jgi:hypothetical protein
MNRKTTISVGRYTPTSDATGTAPGRELSNHTNRSGTTIHGSSSIAVGSIFAFAGSTFGGLAWIGQVEMARGVPWWIGAMVGAMFAGAGLSFVVHGISGVRVQRRVRRFRATHVREPWVWDHPWDESGSRDDSGRRIMLAIWGSVLLGLFAVPFNWVGFFAPDGPLAFAIAAGLMDLLVLWCAWRAIHLVSQRVKYGVSMVRFRRFPFRPGEEVELRLARPPALSAVTGIDATLRCVQERYETRGSGDDRSKVVVAYEVWSTAQKAEVERGELVWRFELPEGLPGTALSERPPRYWELVVAIEAPGVDYAGTFLVPIYEDGRRR